MPQILGQCDTTPTLIGNVYLYCSSGVAQWDLDYTPPDVEGGNTIVVYEVPPPVDITELDPTIGGAMYSAGFALTFTPFIIVYGIRAVLSLIK